MYLGGISDRVRTGDVEDFFKGYGKILDIALKSKFGFIEFEDKYDAEDAIKDLDDTKLCGERVKLELSKGCKDKYRDFRSSGRVRYRSFSREVSPSRGRYRSRSPKGGDRGRDRSRSRSRGRGGDRGRDRGRSGGRDDSRRTFYDKPAYKKYGAPAKTKYTVEVENLSSRCSWQDLKDFMRKAGEVTYGAAHDGEVGKHRGIVCFERKKDAERAIDDLDGRELNGRTVTLKMVIREEWDEEGKSRSRSRSARRSRSPPPRRSRSKSRSRSKKRSRSRSRSERKDSRDRSRSRDKKKSRSKSASKSRSRSRTPEKKSRRSRSRSRS